MTLQHTSTGMPPAHVAGSTRHFVSPQRLVGARWANVLFLPQAESDPFFISPPLPRRQVVGLVMHTVELTTLETPRTTGQGNN